MLTAVLHDFDRLVLEEAPVPDPGPDDVVVRIRSCGFCATDYKAIRGIRRNVRFPLVPGHEPAGVVAKVGSNVHRWREGDEVIVSPSGFCGLCPACRDGKYPLLRRELYHGWRWTRRRAARKLRGIPANRGEHSVPEAEGAELRRSLPGGAGEWRMEGARAEVRGRSGR